MPRLNGLPAIDELGLETPFAAGSETEERTELRLLEALGETPFAAESEGNASDASQGFGAQFGNTEAGAAWSEVVYPEAARQEASPADETAYTSGGQAVVPDMAALQGLLENETESVTDVGERTKGVASFVLGPPLRPGSSGPAVAALQRYLTQLGFDVSADGNFGPGTERALRSFQSRSGTTPDGVAGPRTKAAIAAALGRTGPSVAPAPAPPSGPAPRPSGSPDGGRLVVGQHPVLRVHRGTSPDVILKWTGIRGPGAVDVVVHFHGYSGQKGGMRLDRHKEPHSGLDFSDPADPASPGRAGPTLGILPRGNYFGGRSGSGYDFPALIRPGALHALVQDALARAGQAVGQSLQIGRLILTGHSGGGAPVAAILAHTDPDEVHIFDGTYGSGANIVRWAQRQIARELAAPSAKPPAMRILYRPGTQTASHAEAIARDVCKSLQAGAAARMRSYFRVDATGVGHNEIPRLFGWRLLADPAANLPGARTRACAGAVSGESVADREELEASPFWQDRPTDREESQQETIAMTERQYLGADEGYDVNNEGAIPERSNSEELAWLDLEAEGAASEWFEPETESDLFAPEANWSESFLHESESDAAILHEWLETEEDETESDDERFGEFDSESDAEWESEERDEQPLSFEQSWEPFAEHGVQPEAESGLAASGLSSAERKAVEITSTFETGKRGGFYGLSGNFDGQGLSFGLVNWTIGTGSLQPLLRDFATEHPQRWNAVFGSDAARFLALTTPKGDAARKDQHRFAVEEMNASSVRNGKRVWSIREPWVTYFKRLSEDMEFRKIQLRYVRHLLARAEYFCKYFTLKSEAAFAFMFDAVASHGKWWLTKKIRGRQRRQLRLRERLKTLAQQHGEGRIPEKEILLTIADVLGATSAPRWAAKVRQRKRWFVTGEHPRAKELSGLEPRLDVPYTTSPTPANLDEAFEPAEAAYGYENEPSSSQMTVLESLLEAEAGTGTGLAERVKGVAAFVLGPTLRRGSVGPAVATLQRCLAHLGHAITADGNFGAATEQAVRAFQSRSGITPDGVVGPRTKGAIAAAVGGGTAPSPVPAALPIPAHSSLAEAIARVAEQEYRRWHSVTGKLRETDRAAVPILQQYYREGVNRNVSAAELQDTSWQKQHPWSAVFVSFVMRTAGAGPAFKYSAAHQSYIAAGRRNRLEGVASNPFWAYRATEVAPQVGDLICASRADSGATYDNIGDSQSRATHCDIVTEVRPGSLRVIGGNVNQNVDAKTIRTLPDGRLELDGNQARFFAVLRCRGAFSGTVQRQPLGPPPPQPIPPQPVAKQLTPAQFVAAYGASARASQVADGVPALVTLGQAALESGWGKHAPRFNFFGIKARASDPEHERQLLRTREVLTHRNGKFPEVISISRRPDGKFDYMVRDWFRAYPDAARAFNAHGEFLVRNKRYAKAFQVAHDPYAFAAEVARAGYATDPSYERVLKSVMQKIEAAGRGVREAAAESARYEAALNF